ncbi:uncharacterized protein LAJ45_10474 [Morchella importuna]|uniref:uncharacterized protein n=1 Tax=Morchella importuna TaxID=1174673 RepID=UPI001E8E35F7|nr:uncharacterized protein LAJ45_10474 [Morchella importuna]KAH8145504.1 hypothetical protein LAJ45_10474 [Morchella importuna]
MSAKGAPWQHPASAEPSQMYSQSPNRPSKFTLQEGLDNNWVFFPEPHFVNVDDDEEEDSSDEGHGHHDKSGNRRDSVNSKIFGKTGFVRVIETLLRPDLRTWT